MVAAAAAACAPLTAEAPLFSPADQIGPSPLPEGIWISVSKECPARFAKRRGRLPAACAPAELRRLADGAWLLKAREPAHDGQAAQDHQWRLVIAPATEHPGAEAYAPLYLAEYAGLNGGEPLTPRYAAIAPIGVLPAKEVFVIAEIGCTDILRDGPIAGVSDVRDDKGERIRCIAASQAAVREAVRRAVIENLNGLDENRLLFVRP